MYGHLNKLFYLISVGLWTSRRDHPWRPKPTGTHRLLRCHSWATWDTVNGVRASILHSESTKHWCPSLWQTLEQGLSGKGFVEGEAQNKIVLGPEQQVRSSDPCSFLLPCYYQPDHASNPTNTALDCITVRSGSRMGKVQEQLWGLQWWVGRKYQVEAVGRARKFQWPPTWDNHSQLFIHLGMCVNTSETP